MKWMKLSVAVIYTIAVCLIKQYECSINFFINILLIFPFSMYLILLIHEISHLLIFVLCKIQVTEFCVGLFRIFKYKDRFIFDFKDHNFFSGYCSFKPQRNKLTQVIAALMSGGISGAIISIVSLILILTNAVSMTKPFFCSLFFAGTYSLYATLLRKNSADRIAINKLLKGK